MVDTFGWHQISGTKLLEIHQKVSEFEKRTWNEILVVSKKQNHSVEIKKLCKPARDRLIELGLDDLDALVSLRLSATERIWGIRSHNALTLLWWDPGHQIYPSILRHT